MHVFQHSARNIRYCPGFALLLFDDAEVLKHSHDIVNKHRSGSSRQTSLEPRNSWWKIRTGLHGVHLRELDGRRGWLG